MGYLLFVLVVMMFYNLFFKKTTDDKKSSYNSDNNKTNIKEINYDDDYIDFNDSVCENCSGLGREYYCKNCYSQPTFSGYSEKYDGDLFCKKCAYEGK